MLMLVNCQGCLCTPVIEYSMSCLSNKLPSTISRDNTKDGCEADYNKPPQKRLKKPLGENLLKLLFGLIQLIGSTHPKFDV